MYINNLNCDNEFYFTLMWDLYKARDPLEIDAYRVRGIVYGNMCGRF